MEAGIQVRQAQHQDATVVAGLDVPSLLAQANVNLEDKPTIVMKVDVEGSEREIFRDNIGWLKYISCIAIELHDGLPGEERCSEVFFRAVGPHLVEPPRVFHETTFVRLSPAKSKPCSVNRAAPNCP